MKQAKRLMCALLSPIMAVCFLIYPAFASADDPSSHSLQELQLISEIQYGDTATAMDSHAPTRFEPGDAGENLLGRPGEIITHTGLKIGFKDTGHAAIVHPDFLFTVEAIPRDYSPNGIDGVQKLPNLWHTKRGAKLYRVRGAASWQYQKAAKYAEQQIGKPYNWDFSNRNRTDRFYCSQLVWRAWKEAGIDLSPGSGIISPQDLERSDKTILVRVV